MTQSNHAFASEPLLIESLDLEAQGIAHRSDGKVVFVEGALPFEIVSAHIHRKKNNWEQGVLQQIHQASSQRVEPGCSYFGMHPEACGGCKMQHLNTSSQVAAKQRVLEDNLWHIGKVKPQQMLRPLQGPDWGYRNRARLSVRFVIKKSKVLIGFHERKSRYVADIETCKVLPPHVSSLLLPLRSLIESLDARDQCPQIELACGERVTVMILRHLVALSLKDQSLLSKFGQDFGIQWWSQAKGPESVIPLFVDPDDSSNALTYRLPEFGLEMKFRPTDFTQVNAQINQIMVSRAINMLEIKHTDFVIDWFCGLGNFTLPIATKSERVLGVEGSRSLLDWAEKNRQHNAFVLDTSQKSISFVERNLFEMTPGDLLSFGAADKWLIDPPREGAFALVKSLASVGSESFTKPFKLPQRIVYISCNPATLARDADVLVHQAGYKLVLAGMMNMFPHTAHVESMAVFESP